MRHERKRSFKTADYIRKLNSGQLIKKAELGINQNFQIEDC